VCSLVALVRYLLTIRARRYAVGVTDIAVGLLIGLVCVFFVHTRWARLAALPFLNFGSMQVRRLCLICTSTMHSALRPFLPASISAPRCLAAMLASSTRACSVVCTIDASHAVSSWEIADPTMRLREEEHDKGDDASLEKGSPRSSTGTNPATPWDTLPSSPTQHVDIKYKQAPLLGVSVPIFGPETVRWTAGARDSG
jgi:hypothetical protein